METKDAIKLINQTFNIKLSDEQMAILNANQTTPLLVNACAGSGKTTLYLISIIVRALCGQQDPENVLGITFSKKAQLDMNKRYQENINQLMLNSNAGRQVIQWGNPTFSTFHALFLRLLRQLPQYQYVEVLASYSPFYYDLSRQLDMSKTQLSKREYLSNIFDIYNALINLTYSLDGITPNPNNKIVKLLIADKKATLNNLFQYVTHIALDEHFLDNYTNVITLYQNLKQQHNFLDFSDMKIQLIYALESQVNRQILTNYMARYKQIYIDEFQDIDPLQWILLRKLISPQVFNHLFVIGDDDQSIYAFRGSSPYYITHFASKLMPNAKTLNLSTNYRTGGNILQIAKPIIKNNTTRLHKDLLAFNKNIGKVHIYTDVTLTKDDPYFQKLLETVKNPQASAAMLVRFNKDKTLVSDKLASRGLYTNVSQYNLILQNQTVYDFFIRLMDSFINDNAQEYVELSNKIGFSYYKQMLYEYYEQGMTLQDLLDEAHDGVFNELYNSDNSSMVAHNRYDRRRSEQQLDFLEHSQEMMKIVNNSQSNPTFRSSGLTDYIYQEVKDLVNTFLEYMYQQNIYNKATTNQVIDYVGQLISQTPDWSQFLAKENTKLRFMKGMIEQNKQLPNFQLMTMHQAKGLEFNQVFLYGLTNDVLSIDEYALSKLVPAKITRSHFTDIINNSMRQHTPFLAKMLIYLFKCGNDYAGQLLRYMLHLSQYPYGFMKILNDALLDNHFDNFDYLQVPLNQHAIDKLYYDVSSISNFVEEERRLLYVAITRAKQDLYIALPTAGASPLMQELISAISDAKDQGDEGIEIINQRK